MSAYHSWLWSWRRWTGVTVTKPRTAMEKKHNLRLPTGDTERLQAEKSRLEASLELARQENELLKQQAYASQTAVQNIRNKTGLFRNKMIVDAWALCEFHVQKVEEVKNHGDGEFNRERAKSCRSTGTSQQTGARTVELSEEDREQQGKVGARKTAEGDG
eukprot:244495-Amphidinium_carterae.2